MNFINIQHSHTVAASGYETPYLRTGYESIIPFRVGKLYATMAEEDGVVSKITDKGIIVKYNSGKEQGYFLGDQFGRFENVYCKHKITSTLKLNEKVKKGFPINYNTNFFAPDYLNPGMIVFKTNFFVTVALLESQVTFEDSCGIDKETAIKLKTEVTKAKNFTIEFKQGIHKIVKEGQEVKPDTVLFYIEDQISNETGLFDEEDIETLKRLTGSSPKAKIKGKIDKIEMYYHGDKRDMSVSLRNLANQCDRNLAEKLVAINKPVLTGKVDSEYRTKGKSLQPDTAEIIVYMSNDDIAGVGDKGVIGLQLKTTFGKIYEQNLYTESGERVNVLFGSRSERARIVYSASKIGTTAKLCELVGEKFVELASK